MHHRKLTNETRAAAAASVQGSDLEWLVREIQQKENADKDDAPLRYALRGNELVLVLPHDEVQANLEPKGVPA